MPRLEEYNSTIIYTDGVNGAYLELYEEIGWFPFKYFDDGSMDFAGKRFKNHNEAFDYAVKTFT